jgi:hypothetical protein
MNMVVGSWCLQEVEIQVRRRRTLRGNSMSDRGKRLPSLGDEHEFEAKEIFWKIATEGRILTDAEFAAECKRLEELGWYYDRESKRWARDLQPRS